MVIMALTSQRGNDVSALHQVHDMQCPDRSWQTSFKNDIAVISMLGNEETELTKVNVIFPRSQKFAS